LQGEEEPSRASRLERQLNQRFENFACSRRQGNFGNRLPADVVSPLENGVLNHTRHFFDAKNELKKKVVRYNDNVRREGNI
jgi:hypothetical protein